MFRLCGDGILDVFLFRFLVNYRKGEFYENSCIDFWDSRFIDMLLDIDIMLDNDSYWYLLIVFVYIMYDVLVVLVVY